MSKKNALLEKAQWSIIELFLNLPIQYFLSAMEIKELMVDQLDVSTNLTVDDLRSALSKHIGDLITVTTHGKNKTKYYVKTTSRENCIPFDRRPPGWKLPVLENFTDTINDYVISINEFLCKEPIESPIMKTCKGFTGPKINNLFKASFIGGPFQQFDMEKMPMPQSFGLPECLRSNKGGQELQFTENKDRSWKFASKSCTLTFEASPNGKQLYCQSCAKLRIDVKNICQRIRTDEQIDVHAIARMSERTYLELAHRPADVRSLFQKSHQKKDKVVDRLRSENASLNEKLQRVMDKQSESVEVENIVDVERGRKALEYLKPVIQKKFGEGSDAVLIWEQMIAGMCRPNPRYNSAALLYAIELANQTKADVYDKVATLLNFPSRTHCKRVQRHIIYGKDGCFKTGFQAHTVSQFRKLAKENKKLEKGLVAVALSFDTMIMKKNLILSSRNEDKGRFFGCAVSDDLCTLERQFEDYVQKVTRQARQDGDTIFDESMQEPFQQNKEHLVCYARCMTPGVDLSFIAGAWNLPACRKIDLMPIIHEVILGLMNHRFEVRALTCDNAQSNDGFFKMKASIEVRQYLPKSWLEDYRLDGEFMIGMEHPITRNPIFFVNDPPHCLKTLAGAVRNRNLQYDGCPMTGLLLRDVWRAIQLSFGDDTSLIAHRKYVEEDFLGGGPFSAMDVSSAARLFSGTTRKMVDNVVNHPQKYPLQDKLPAGVNRKRFYSRVGELVTIVNHFFDLCNGKENGNVFLSFHPSNAEKYAKKFLSVLKWFGDWEQSLKAAKPDYDPFHFIAKETYRSLKCVCYGLACLIKYECVDNGRRISLSRVNQDICEHHFANVRRSCSTHANPNEMECMAAVMKSAFFRLDKVRKSNCGTVTNDHQRTVLPVSLALHQPKKRKKSNAQLRTEYGKSKKRVFNTVKIE